MTKPTGNPRGRPKKKRTIAEETAGFLRAIQGDGLPPGRDCLFVLCCDDIKREMSIDILATMAASSWLAAMFMELEFFTIVENAEMSHDLKMVKTALAMKGLRAQRCVMLMARAYECAAGKRAASPTTDKNGHPNGPFFRFTKFIARNSSCPILWPRSDSHLKGLIDRALKLRNDPGQREFERLALFNAMHGMRGACFPRESD